MLLRKEDNLDGGSEYFVDSSSQEAIQKLNDSLKMLETADETGAVLTSIEDFANQLSLPKEIFSRRYPVVYSDFLKKMYLKHVCYKNHEGNREPLVDLGWKNGRLKIGVPAKPEALGAFLYFQKLYQDCPPDNDDFYQRVIKLPYDDIFQDIHNHCEVYTDESGNDLPIVGVSRKRGEEWLRVIKSRKSLRALLTECEKRGISIQKGDLKDEGYQSRIDCTVLSSTNSFKSKLRKYYKRERTNNKN